MKFETVLSAYGKVANQYNCPTSICNERRVRQAAKFRAWLIAYAAKSCRPKRLEWKMRVIRLRYEAHSPIGRYEIWRGMNGYSCHFFPVLGERTMIAESIDSLDDAIVEAQTHFDSIWREMTDGPTTGRCAGRPVYDTNGKEQKDEL